MIAPVSAKLSVGLALGAGAARGWAHLGVINALKERGIEPDVITGTSIGSIVGAAYALDRHDQLCDWVKSLTRKHVLSLMDFRFNGGIVAGDKLMRALEEHMGHPRFEETRIPFGCVATDLAYGSEYWLRHGDMLSAIRASIALPGLFPPTQKDGRWLADGGMVNPVPVSLCRTLGADVVIAVDLNSDLLDGFEQHQELPEGTDANDWRTRLSNWADDIGERLGINSDEPSMVEVMSRSINIMSVRITRSRMAGDPPRVVIEPRLARINTMDFHLAEQAIEEGVRAVERVGDELDDLKKRLSRQ